MPRPANRKKMLHGGDLDVTLVQVAHGGVADIFGVRLDIHGLRQIRTAEYDAAVGSAAAGSSVPSYPCAPHTSARMEFFRVL